MFCPCDPVKRHAEHKHPPGYGGLYVQGSGVKLAGCVLVDGCADGGVDRDNEGDSDSVSNINSSNNSNSNSNSNSNRQGKSSNNSSSSQTLGDRESGSSLACSPKSQKTPRRISLSLRPTMDLQLMMNPTRYVRRPPNRTSKRCRSCSLTLEPAQEWARRHAPPQPPPRAPSTYPWERHWSPEGHPYWWAAIDLLSRRDIG